MLDWSCSGWDNEGASRPLLCGVMSETICRHGSTGQSFMRVSRMFLSVFGAGDSGRVVVGRERFVDSDQRLAEAP